MFVVNSLPVAIALCIVTMLGWGSWANTQKLAGKEKWPFELYYWDYAIGVFLFGFIFAHTLGSTGSAGMGASANMHAAANAYVGVGVIAECGNRIRSGGGADCDGHRGGYCGAGVTTRTRTAIASDLAT